MQLARSCSGKKIMATRAAELKLRGGKRVLVTTKLCEAMLKSRAGYEFDSSFCCDVNNVFEYNGLQDPHLKDYFYRPFMKEYLMNKNFITPYLKVISGRKEYTAYRAFLRDEITKFKIGREKAAKENEIKKKTRKWGKFTLLDEEREMRKIQSLEKQEKKTLAKQNMLEMVELKQKMDLRMELEKRHIQRVKDQLQKNSNVELKKLKLLKKKQMEEVRSQKMNAKMEIAKQRAERKENYLKRMGDFESQWEQQQAVQEEEGKRLEKRLDEKMKTRAKSIIFRDIPESNKDKPTRVVKSNLWFHLLQEQADIREREWGSIRRYNLEGWEAVNRQWDQLRVQLRLRREAWRRENEKLLQVLTSEASTSCFGKKVDFSLRGFSGGDVKDERDADNLQSFTTPNSERGTDVKDTDQSLATPNTEPDTDASTSVRDSRNSRQLTTDEDNSRMDNKKVEAEVLKEP